MSKKYIGLDFSEGLARFAVVDQDNGTVSTAVEAKWEPGTEANTSMDVLKREYEAIKKTADELPLQYDVVFSVPADCVFSRYFELPPLRSDQLDTAIQTRIRKYYPINAKNHYITQVEVPVISSKKKQKGYIAFIVNRDRLDRQSSLLKDLGLRVAHVDLPHAAIARWLLWENPNVESGNRLFVHIHRDFLIFGGSKDKSLFLAKAVKPTLMYNPLWLDESLESLKDMKPFVVELVNEIEAMLAYTSLYTIPEEIKMDALIVTGRFCKDETLNAELNNRLKIPIRIYESKKMKFDKSISPADYYLYEISAGLSLRILEESIWL